MSGDSMVAGLVFTFAVVVLVLVGIRLGMLIAPRIDRLSGADDEVDRADDE